MHYWKVTYWELLYQLSRFTDVLNIPRVVFFFFKLHCCNVYWFYTLVVLCEITCCNLEANRFYNRTWRSITRHIKLLIAVPDRAVVLVRLFQPINHRCSSKCRPRCPLICCLWTTLGHVICVDRTLRLEIWWVAVGDITPLLVVQELASPATWSTSHR